MSVNEGLNPSNKMYKNVQLWIADVLELYKPSLNSGAEFNCEIEKNKTTNSDLTAMIKTVAIVGVIVGVRNEREELFLPEGFHSDEAQCNRPIVYGMYN